MSTAQAALTADERAELHSALERLRAENEEDLAHARDTMETLNEDHTVIEPALHEVAANAEYMIEDATAILAQIDDALGRLADGGFGVCTGCQLPIPKARLELRPYVATCVACSS